MPEACVSTRQLKSEESLAEFVESEILTGDELKSHMTFRVQRGLTSLMALKTGEDIPVDGLVE